METRHPLDAKMKQSQVALFKVIPPTIIAIIHYSTTLNSGLLLDFAL
jgi:hypothetical protein